LCHTLEFTRVVERVTEMMPAEFVQLGGQGLDRQFRQRIQGGLLGQNQATGNAKDVRERLDAAVGTGFEEEEV